MTPALLRSDSMIRVLKTPLGMEAGVNVVPSTTSFKKNPTVLSNAETQP
jgi:hypothetical protein